MDLTPLHLELFDSESLRSALSFVASSFLNKLPNTLLNASAVRIQITGEN